MRPVTGFITDRRATVVVWLVLIAAMTSVSFAAPQSISITKIGVDAVNTGSLRFGDAEVELRGRGQGIDKKYDNILYAYGTCSGNLDVRAHIASITDTVGNSQSGILIRTDTTVDAACVALVHSMNVGTLAYYRSTANTPSKSITVSALPARFLRIVRKGDKFSFFYKFQADSAYRQFPTSYSVKLASMVYGGVMMASGVPLNTTATDFDSIAGLDVKADTAANRCQPVLWNFNGTTPLGTLGFREIKYWMLDTNKYIRTISPGGADSIAHIRTPAFAARRSSDTLAFSWDLFVDRDTAPGLEEYALYSNESMTIDDRAEIVTVGELIASKAGITVGHNAALSSSIHSGGFLILYPRSTITGNVMCGATVFIDTQSSILGTVIENQMPKFPVIAQKSISVGSTSITVNPNDSLALSPGNYNEIHVYANAKLRLSRGAYNCNRFFLEPDVKLYIVADSLRRIDVNVQTEMHFGDRDKMILSDTTMFRYVHFYGNQTAAMGFGTNVRVFGYFSLPLSNVTIESRGLYIDGGIAAKKITLRPDVQINFRGTQPRNDIVTTVIYPNDTLNDYYSLRFTIHRCFGTDTLKDFVFLHRDTVIGRGSDNEITPARKWLRFFVQFPPLPSIKATIYYDDGYGKMPIIDSVRVAPASFTSMAFNFLTGFGVEQHQVRLDNIAVSCVAQPCPEIVVIRQPSDTTVYEGVSAQFSCVIDTVLPAIYQWYKNGGAIPVTNAPRYRLMHADIADNGSAFSCRIVTECDTVMTRAAFLTVLPCAEPQILAQPASCTTSVGGSATFTVNAAGVGLTYRWTCNNRDTLVTLLPSLTLTSVTAEKNLDQFQVIVKNGCGKIAVSNPAVLWVRGVLPCKIKIQPRPDTLEENEIYSTGIVMSCQNGSVTWYKNGVVLPSMTTTRLTYGPVALSDNGAIFSCVIANGECSDTSLSVTIVVRPQKPGSRILAISGELFNPANTLAANDSARFMFRIRLFGTKTKFDSLYTETFTNILVHNGQFTLSCGRGKSHGDLQAVAASNKELFAEVSSGLAGGYEVLGPRLPLTAAPYAWRIGIKVLFGVGIPSSTAAEAQLGALYVDRADGGRTWKMTNTGWVKLD